MINDWMTDAKKSLTPVERFEQARCRMTFVDCSTSGRSITVEQ